MSSTRYSDSQADSSSSKKPRSSVGAVALQGIHNSLSSFTDSVRELANTRRQAKETSPKRRERAARTVEEREAYLPDSAILSLLKHFQNHPDYADTYLGIQRESLHRGWIKSCLEEIGYPIETIVELRELEDM